MHYTDWLDETDLEATFKKYSESHKKWLKKYYDALKVRENFRKDYDKKRHSYKMVDGKRQHEHIPTIHGERNQEHIKTILKGIEEIKRITDEHYKSMEDYKMVFGIKL